MISFDFPSTATCPKLTCASVAHALTKCNGRRPDPAEPHNDLPSMAI